MDRLYTYCGLLGGVLGYVSVALVKFGVVESWVFGEVSMGQTVVISTMLLFMGLISLELHDRLDGEKEMRL